MFIGVVSKDMKLLGKDIMKQRFRLSRQAKIKSVLVCSVLILLLALYMYVFQGGGIFSVVVIPCIVPFCICLFSMSLYTDVSEDHIVLKLLSGTRMVFPKNDCRITKIERDFLDKFSSSTFRSSGIMGYSGTHWSKETGNVRMYCRNLDEMAFVETSLGKKYIINFR